jgi:hypothetical protein
VVSKGERLGMTPRGTLSWSVTLGFSGASVFVSQWLGGMFSIRGREAGEGGRGPNRPVPHGRVWEMSGRHPYGYPASIGNAKPHGNSDFCCSDMCILSY